MIFSIRLITTITLAVNFGFCSCEKSTSSKTEPNNEQGYLYDTLKIIDTLDIGISEPSGLCFNSSNNCVYVISDSPNNIIYEINSSGNITNQIQVNATDLEGITFREKDSTFWVLDEYSNEIICLNNTGLEINRYEVEIDIFTFNKGLEGITYNTKDGYFYLITEKDLGRLVVWSSNTGIINEIELDFAMDYSGITYDASLDALWIVSDESKTLFFCDLKGKPLKQYFLGINGIEGIAPINNENIFIGACDLQSRVFIFNSSSL